MDFETTIKIIVSVAAVVAIPIAAYAAIAATRAIWVRGVPAGSGVTERLEAEVDDLRTRLAELESGQVRIAELEERLDFAERLLVQARDRTLEDVDTPPEPLPSPR